MSYPPKVNAALTALSATDVKSYKYIPPLHRLLWWIGMPLPPPHFASFSLNLTIMAVTFGLFWGLTKWFITWLRAGYSPINVFMESVVVGFLFGIVMAFHYRREANDYNLPKWSEIEPLP